MFLSKPFNNDGRRKSMSNLVRWDPFADFLHYKNNSFGDDWMSEPDTSTLCEQGILLYN